MGCVGVCVGICDDVYPTLPLKMVCIQICRRLCDFVGERNLVSRSHTTGAFGFRVGALTIAGFFV